MWLPSFPPGVLQSRFGGNLSQRVDWDKHNFLEFVVFLFHVGKEGHQSVEKYVDVSLRNMVSGDGLMAEPDDLFQPERFHDSMKCCFISPFIT